MPRLRDVTLEAWDPKALMQLKLIDTPVLSLRLACQPRHGEPDDLIKELWVDGIVPLLRSVPRLEAVELLAPSSLILMIIGILEKEPNLCTELREFTVTAAAKGPGVGVSAKDATSEELKCMAAAVVSQRFQRRSTQ